MRYPYLLFDADNTLFDFDASEHDTHVLLCKWHGLHFSEENYALYHQCNAQLWRDYDRGLCTKDFLLTERFRRYLERTGEQADPEAMRRDHARGLVETSRLFPGAEELCRQLCKDHSLYILTNAVASVQTARFANSPLPPYFKDVFISETIGHGKPKAEYFDYVFGAVPGLTRENCLVIGDSLSSDIQGANNYGLPCCWFNPKGLPRPEGLRIDYEVDSLEQILEIV